MADARVCSLILFSYGTIFVAGSLQAPAPALPMARTRTHWRVPVARPVSAVLELVTAGCAVQLVAVMRSGLVWIS